MKVATDWRHLRRLYTYSLLHVFLKNIYIHKHIDLHYIALSAKSLWITSVICIMCSRGNKMFRRTTRITVVNVGWCWRTDSIGYQWNTWPKLKLVSRFVNGKTAEIAPSSSRACLATELNYVEASRRVFIHVDIAAILWVSWSCTTPAWSTMPQECAAWGCTLKNDKLARALGVTFHR